MKKVAVLTSCVLIISTTAFIAKNGLDAITQKIQKYFAVFSAEKLYLHFSEDVWVAGEKIWCKAYLVKDSNLKWVTDSKVMYVDLRNRQGEIVQTLTLNPSSGIAKGSFVLADSLSNGWYQIHAYTHWMQNFEVDNHFIRPIFVVNPLQEIPQNLRAETWMAEDINFLVFSPAEQLLAGITNTVKVGFTKKNGEGIAVNASIVNEKDSLIATIQTNTTGIGKTQFLPEHGNSYFLKTVMDGDILQYPLPNVTTRSVVLDTQITSDALVIRVSKLDENYRNNNLSLVAVSGEKIVFAEPVKLHSAQTEVRLPFSLFQQGMGHIALFDGEDEILDTKKVLVPSDTNLKISITTKRNSYAPRQNGQITLALSDQQGNPVSAEASVSIRKVNVMSDAIPKVHINQSFIPKEDSAGFSHSYHDFDWHDIIEQSLPEVRFAKETEGIQIKGKLLTTDGAPLGGQRVVVSVAGEEPWFQYDDTQEDGSFRLLIERVFGEKNVVIQAPGVEESYQIILEEDAAEMQVPPLQFLPHLDLQALESFIQQCRQRVKIGDMYAFYMQDTTDFQQKQKRQITPFRFYGVPNMSLYLEDFISLPNLEEVCRELLPGVQMRMDGDQHDFNVFDVRTRKFLEGEPSLFVDGVLVYDKEKVAQYPPANIVKIETINRPTFYGDFSFNGVLSLFTEEGRQYESMLSQNALQTTLSFYDKPENFTTGLDTTVQKRTPDLRSLLYWNPDVKFDDAGKVSLTYDHSDETGQFEVVVEGITHDGQPFSKVMEYEVVFQ